MNAVVIASALSIILCSFNTNGIVFDNTPWRPGRDIDVVEKESLENERRLKNLATRIMSNGVEVLVKDKKPEAKNEQRKSKHIHESAMQPEMSSPSASKQLLSSAVATVVSRQQISALFPLHQLMRHNYIIKTCMTTYTYLTTVVHNKRSAISTFETIVSVVTTESLTNLYATDIIPDLKPTKTKHFEVKTIQPSAATNMYMSVYPKIDKRIDNEEANFDLIQPSEVSSVGCTSSCPCSNTKTESLNTKFTNGSPVSKYTSGITSTKYGVAKIDLQPTDKETSDMKTKNQPYEYETNSHLAPTDKVVEKYTEVINDYSDEKESNSVEQSELLTNEQAPAPIQSNKVNIKNPEKIKPDKPQKPNKNKFVVADLLKLGSLGIKGLSQLAPVIEKMTGGFIKRNDNFNKTTTTTIKPEMKLTAYSANKRIDNDFEAKHSNFPIYIPVDEMETSESQIYYSNATLHQNFAWAAEHKQPKAHMVLPKIIHESPLVNGGIPISPGEIINANSDVIVGKPAVGGPLTLAASGIKLHSSMNSPPIDSFVSGNEQYIVSEKPQRDQPLKHINMDQSYDLRPPEPPKPHSKGNKPMQRPGQLFNVQNIPPNDQYPYRMPPSKHDHLMNTEQIKSTTVVGNHGRPMFLDYIPSLAKPGGTSTQHHVSFKPLSESSTEIDVMDNSPSSSEVVNTQIKTVGEYAIGDNSPSYKPFLVDIQPSRVANVLIPHGSSTALVFAGSSEPHKTGDYIDDPLPYPEPGYFGSFSIDAPQMTNVHNVVLNGNKQLIGKPNLHTVPPSYKPPTSTHKDQLFRNDLKDKWKDTKRPLDLNKIPPPTSNQETHLQVGPQITVYNPDTFNPNTNEFDSFNQVGGKLKIKDTKDIIDKEYENYLAVPPPPPAPSKQYHNQDVHEKPKPYAQRPIVHTKPVQDMKVFLNIQHPIPEKLPPRVTSEIYFASQMPNSKPTPTYTIRMPQASYNKYSHSPPNNVLNSQSTKLVDNTKPQIHNSFNVISSHASANASSITHSNNDNNTYTVTLNTATNVASNSEAGQVIGSSVAVPISLSQNNAQFNADIPIGTNFAIRVEDNTAPPETFYLHQGSRNPAIIYNQHSNALHSNTEPQLLIGDNRWNKSSTNKPQTTGSEDSYYKKKYGNSVVHSEIQPILPSINSHANFPMINDNTYTTASNNIQEVKAVTESIENNKSGETKRPAKLIPNIPTNSHGWYSSVFNDNNINNIKLEVTTRKVIPLNYDFGDANQVPQFGQKIASIGKPPTEIWSQKVLSGINVGKPFTKPQSTERPHVSSVPLTTKPLKVNYIPSNFGVIYQPAYDIPIRDNSDEITTHVTKTTTEHVKPVYENSDVIYDGEEEVESPGDLDGEVSSESMKIPVVSTSNEVESVSTKSTELTLLQDEIYTPPSNGQKHDNDSKVIAGFNTGTQTEKPFGSFRNKTLQSNTIRPIYEHPSSNPYMKPRPFTINSAIVLDHQLHQPHWQINHMMENSSNVSYEDNIDLNIGEEIEKPSSAKPFSTVKPVYTTESVFKYKQPPRLVYKDRVNNTHLHNESIITSSVNIQDKKPLIVKNVTEKTTLPSITFSNMALNRSSTEIIDLSPPPPTLDYNFKPSTNNEMIMGMSPPPPRTPSGIRLPTRLPITPRPAIPPRTLPPYRTKPPRPISPRVTTQRPMRRPASNDEVSTYRPAFDLLNGIRRPSYNRDQPSSLLLPPPREIPSRVSGSAQSIAPVSVDESKIVFPTPISSGWLTSPASDYSSGFEVNFAPTSVQFPSSSKPSRILESTENPSSESYYSYEDEISLERLDDKNNVSKEITTESTTSTTKTTSTGEISDSIQDQSYEWSSVEVPTTDKLNVISLGNKNRTRKPYPIRSEQKKNNTNRFKLPVKVPITPKPIKTLPRPDILYPTRPIPNKNILRPYPRPPTVIEPSMIESSEQSIDAGFVKPTEVLKSSVIPTVSQVDTVSLEESEVSSIPTPTVEEVVKLEPTHHAGNEVKISDEIIPTKTEFRTTVVTLTKTLSEPPQTISSIGYVNLTHTLTVTHTKTSLVSQSEGAKTQTLVLTNTHTSTIVDVVTEVYTQVQPTTIIETVTKHIPIPQVQPTVVQGVVSKTKIPLDDVTMSSEESENFIIKDTVKTAHTIQKIEHEADNEPDNDTFFVVMNKSQNGGQAPPVSTDVETGDYDVTRNEQVSNNGVSQVLFGEILLAGAPYLETTNVNGAYSKECQPDCKASRNERCQRIDGIMKCICRPGFARMFPDRPCKPTYTYSVKLALGSQGNESLVYNEHLSDNSSKQYHALAVATHAGINRMVMQSDLRDVYHGVHITSFHPVEMKSPSGDLYQGVMNDFYVQLSDNAHESRLKEVFEKYLRNNNYSLGGTEVHAAGELMDKLDVSDFDECLSGQFHDCSEHAQCFNLRGTYTCSCLEGFADLSVNTLYPGRICSAEPVGCERCNYHGACYSRDDRRVLCECFQWYSGSTCQINLKVVLISLVVCGALLSAVLAVCAVLACTRRSRTPPHPQRSIVACIQGMPSLHQGAVPKQRADRRALISERGESGDAASLQNASLPYIPAKQHRSSTSKKCVMSDPPAHDPPPPPAPAVMIPRARLLPHHGDSRENIARKRSLELSSEAKLISYLESGATTSNDEMRRKHSLESSYSANKDRHNKQGALVSAGFKVSTTIRPDVEMMKSDRDDLSSVNKGDLDAELSRYDHLRKAYSQEDLSEWTDAERRLGELTLSEARSVGGTLPASTGRAASSTRLTHQEANTMAERDLGSTFLLPHVHLYKPDLTSDVSEFDSL